MSRSVEHPRDHAVASSATPPSLSWWPLSIEHWEALSAGLTLEQEGALIRVCCRSWRDPEFPGTIIDTPASFDRLLGRRAKVLTSVIKQHFVPDSQLPGRLRCVWLTELHRQQARKYSTAVANGRKGGRPPKAETNRQENPPVIRPDSPPDTPPGNASGSYLDRERERQQDTPDTLSSSSSSYPESRAHDGRDDDDRRFLEAVDRLAGAAASALARRFPGETFALIRDPAAVKQMFDAGISLDVALASIDTIARRARSRPKSLNYFVDSIRDRHGDAAANRTRGLSSATSDATEKAARAPKFRVI